MIFKTPQQVVRVAVVIAAIATLQNVRIEDGHASKGIARTTPRVQGWAGGALGGSGPPVSVLLTGDFDGDGAADDDRTLHHDVNLRNQITALTEQGESGGPVVHDPALDTRRGCAARGRAASVARPGQAGNVVLHGEYYYQFDAFNRLVQVNLLGAAQVNAEDGRIVGGALGDLVAQYMYDGLGRLMAKRTPERLSSPKLQTKDYYYDGVRRVMEVITRHGVPPEPGRNDELKEREGEGEGEGGGEGGEDPPGLPPLPVVEQWTDREYVYGPDYVDEFIAQFDRDGRPMLMLQDGNFNVVALVAGADDVFFDASTNGLPAGSVLEQYVYDPYGGVRQADSFAEHAVNRVGHQGLFFDRFDGDWEHAGLAPGAVGLYYNRNRYYSPPSLRNVGDAENPDWRLVGLGRFISADPNETALTLISALAMNGERFGGPDSNGFDLSAHYGDGFNLYQYLVSNPANNWDPLGLFTFADLLSSTAARDVMEAYGGYQTAKRVYMIASQLAAGVAWQQVLLTAAIEAAFDWAGGKAFDFAFKRLRAFTEVRFANLAKGVTAKLTGQLHHAISKKIWKALENHPNLKGKYSFRDTRFASRAATLPDHNGYQDWHRKLDAEVADWIERNQKATKKEFEAYLAERYARPDLAARFPGGLGPESLFK